MYVLGVQDVVDVLVVVVEIAILLVRMLVHQYVLLLLQDHVGDVILVVMEVVRERVPDVKVVVQDHVGDVLGDVEQLVLINVDNVMEDVIFHVLQDAL